MTENNKLQTIEQQLVQEKNVSDNVLNKVRVLESQGNLELPNDYSPSNAMKQAWLQISQDNKLMSCNDTSKANALLDMVTQGLNPAKNQCYFIPYGNKMQLQRSYHGNVMMLKRDAGAQDVVAQVIYKGDTFKQEMGETGRIKAIKHEQDFFNIDKENIIGAYCTIVFNDGRDNYIEVMTIEQIKQAWMQSSMIKDEKALQNSKTHNNFKEEQESEQRQRKEVLDAEVEENANQEQLDFEQPVLEEAQYTELENDKPIDVSDFEEIKEPATEKESEEEPF